MKDAKHFVLDTNVLIADPKAMFKFGSSNVVIIPMTVIEELDGLKKSMNNTGNAARQVARDLNDLRKDGGRLDKGIKLPNGGFLRVETEIAEPSFDFVGKLVNDHYILQVARTLEQRGIKKVVLVSEDNLLLILADANGIEAQRYREIAVEDLTFYSETKTANIDEETFKNLADKDTASVDEIEGLVDNEYIRVIGSNGGSLMARYESRGPVQLRRVFDEEVFRVTGRNLEQRLALHALMDPEITLVALAGKAGTGKTLLALAAGLQQVIEPKSARYEKITIARPIVSMGKELGYLPGDLKEKLDPWMAPIYDNVEQLFKGAADKAHRASILGLLVDKGQLQIEALSYIRGRSMPNQFFVIDECQNLTPHELKTIITRAGEGTKIVLTGDPYQIDSPYLDQHSNGLSYVIDAFRGQPMFANVTLHKGERSDLAEIASKLL